MTDWLPRLVARVPVTAHAKLLAAFLTIAVLLIVVGAVGLQVLTDINRRAEAMVGLHRKVAAYRQLQHDTTGQLYSVASALAAPDQRTLEAMHRPLNQCAKQRARRDAFGYDLDRVQFVTRDEVELLGRVREDYERFIGVIVQGGGGADGAGADAIRPAHGAGECHHAGEVASGPTRDHSRAHGG